jgi:hypothetical protein
MRRYEPKLNPVNNSHYKCILRGGHWRYGELYCLSGYRVRGDFSLASTYMGLRLILNI